MRVLYHRTVKTSLVGDPVQQFLIDITADIVEGSLENFSKAVNGVGLFEFEVDDLDVELINQQRKYFGGLWGSADYPITGSVINPKGKYDLWTKECIEIWEGNKLRFMGYIFNDDVPIEYDPETDVLTFRIYDPSYVLNLCMLGKPDPDPNHPDTASRFAHRHRWKRVFEVEDDGGGSREYAVYISQLTFDELTSEQKTIWEKVYMFDSYSGLSSENSNSWVRVELHDFDYLITEGLYGYRRSDTATPTELKLFQAPASGPDIMRGVTGLVNHWNPFFQLSLGMTLGDIGELTREFFLTIPVEEAFNQLDFFKHPTPDGAGTAYRYLGLTFGGAGGSTDETYYQNVALFERVNQINMHRLLRFSFPAFPGLLGNVGVRIHNGREFTWNRRGNHTRTEVRAGAIRYSSSTFQFVIWRLLRRTYRATKGTNSHPLRLNSMQYCFQYYIIDLSSGELVTGNMHQINQERNYFYGTGVYNSPQGEDDWDDYYSLEDVNDNIVASKTRYNPKFDTNEIVDWGLNDRYYAPARAYDRIFYHGFPTMDQVAFDLEDYTATQFMGELAKLTNSAFKVLSLNRERVSWILGSRQFYKGTLTLQDVMVVDERLSIKKLTAEDLPTVESDIIGSDSFNEALSQFYGEFFKQQVIETQIEVIRNTLEHTEYDCLWRLQVGHIDKGIIQSVEETEQTVIFTCRRYVHNEQVRGQVR